MKTGIDLRGNNDQAIARVRRRSPCRLSTFYVLQQVPKNKKANIQQTKRNFMIDRALSLSLTKKGTNTFQSTRGAPTSVRRREKT